MLKKAFPLTLIAAAGVSTACAQQNRALLKKPWATELRTDVSQLGSRNLGLKKQFQQTIALAEEVELCFCAVIGNSCETERGRP